MNLIASQLGTQGHLQAQGQAAEQEKEGKTVRCHGMRDANGMAGMVAIPLPAADQR